MSPLKVSLILGWILLSSFAKAQSPKKEWTFFQKESGQKRHFRQGQDISVTWYGISGTKISKGQLEDIGSDSLMLSLDNHVLGIAKKDIGKITTKKHGLGAILLSALLVLGGAFITGFFILAQIAYNLTRTDYQLAHHEQKAYWPWALLGIGLIGLGFFTLKSLPSKTKDPFNKQWNIKEKQPNTEKMP